MQMGLSSILTYRDELAHADSNVNTKEDCTVVESYGRDSDADRRQAPGSRTNKIGYIQLVEDLASPDYVDVRLKKFNQ